MRDAPAPSSIEELLRHPELIHPLLHGIVFVHDKSSVSDRLLDLVEDIAPHSVRFEAISEPAVDADLLVEKLKSRNRRSKKSTVYVLRAGSMKDSIEGTVRSVCAGPAGWHALWVFGFSSDFPNYLLRLFDVILIFGSSSADIDRLRSVMPIPERVAKALSADTADLGDEQVVVFFNTERPIRGWTIRMTRNPAVLDFRIVQSAGINMRPGMRYSS
jgi:hypothetical protein